MIKKTLFLLTISMLFLVLIHPEYARSQQGPGMTKWEYYNKLCQDNGWVNKLSKSQGFADRKYGMLDVGKVRLQINNANRLGYSREMITYEYPIGSGITYNWVQGLIVGGIVLI